MTDERSADEELDSRLAALPHEIPPQRNLWPDIAARIAAVSAAPRADRELAAWWQSGWTQLAAACVLVAVTAVVTYQLVREPEGTAMPPQVAALDWPVITTLPATPASFGSGAVLSPEYVEARALLARTFEARLADLPPATRSKIERNLAEIRRASAELAAALDEHPANSLLQDLLVSTYQEELALFSQVNQVTTATQLRNDL